MPNTGRNAISKENQSFYNTTLLREAKPSLVHTRFGQINDLPQHAGTDNMTFRRYAALPRATTPLSEGITPAGKKLSETKINVTIYDYGDFVTITDKINWESEDPVLMIAAETLGRQAGETIDELCREVLNAGTNVQRVGDRLTRGAVVAGDKMDVATVKKAVLTLKNANAKKLVKQINASTGYATEPIKACYIGIAHPNIVETMSGLTGWVPVEKYARQQNIMEDEVGKLGDVRFIETTEAKVFEGEGDSSIDVYSTLIIAKDAYGVSRVSGKAMENIVKPFGSGEDPLNQRATSGWKATFATLILNDDYMVRIESSSEY